MATNSIHAFNTREGQEGGNGPEGETVNPERGEIGMDSRYEMCRANEKGDL